MFIFTFINQDSNSNKVTKDAMKSSTHGVFRDLTATEEELVMILKHGEVLKKLSKRFLVII
jgi:hypothetical protein